MGKSLGKSARNEKLKLAANLFNTIGASSIVAGFVVPAIGLTEHTAKFGFGWHLVAVVLLWCLAGASAHSVGQLLLERLVD
jgi:hypothetical protein